ncbi:MAG: O-antigen ligase family protein [Desulfitobacteriia bacterium]|jgi:putative inorganic carbon (HCO3(-)) transporter
MFQWVMLGITVILLGVLMIRKPLWLVPLLGAALALEISVTWYPEIDVVSRMLGPVSLALLTSVAIILAALVRLLFFPEMVRKLRAVLKDFLTLTLILFLVLGAASVIYSADPGKTVAEAGMLCFLLVLFISIALLMDKDKALLPLKAVHGTALLLSPLAFYEGFFDSALWQADNLLREQALGVSATFASPDGFARYIILAIAANFIIQLYVRDKGNKMVYWGALAILLAELAMTYSLGGILTLAIILILALIFIPNRSAVLWVLGLGVFCGALFLFIRPDIWGELMNSIQNFATANPERYNLWQEALAAFKANVILGTGLGSFAAGHFSTSILTIAAELGILGLSLLAILWIVLCGRLFTLYAQSSDFLSMFNNYNNEYYVGNAYLLWTLTILVNSQMEGRFFEDPFLWLSCALLVVLKLNREYNIRLD